MGRYISDLILDEPALLAAFGEFAVEPLKALPLLFKFARLLLERTQRRLRAQDIEIEFSEEALVLLAEEGFDPEFGARPLRRTIQRRVDNELSRRVLEGSLNPGDKVVVGADDGRLTFEVLEGTAAVGTADRAEAGE